MRRGRPPHPDILTPRQWEVLDLLRQGLTDPEIAQRLGVSLDGAKYHVSEILSKLNVTSRDEAAAWQPPEPELERVPRRSLAWSAAGLSLLVVASMGIGILVWGAFRSGTGDDDADPGNSNPGAPRIGQDHWHATYTFYACGVKQPNAPTWEGVGVHTHGDGVIHIHPFTAAEEGAGARLVKWFEYGSGKLDEDEVRLPGLSKTWLNGEACPDDTPDGGKPGLVQVYVNGAKLDDYSEYIPNDGDRVRVVFGPEDELVQLDDRMVIPEDRFTREFQLVIAGAEADTRFSPQTIAVDEGESVKIVVVNASDVSHGVRFAGEDSEYGTADDFVAIPEGSDPTKADEGDIIPPQQSGFVIVRFDSAGAYDFKDPTANSPAGELQKPEPYAVGTIVVTDLGNPSTTGTPPFTGAPPSP